MKEIIIKKDENYRKVAVKLSNEVVEIREEFKNFFTKEHELFSSIYINKEEFKALKKLFEN